MGSISTLQERLCSGLVIPAHPLALTESRDLDVDRQGALTRYYLNVGVGGIATAVHTTQYELHSNQALYKEVLAISADEVKRHRRASEVVSVAGLTGTMDRVVSEAMTARGLGYDVGLLSMTAWTDWTEDRILEGVRAVGEILPVFAFHPQMAIGGRRFSNAFWVHLFELPCVIAMKVAAFNQYETVAVMRSLAMSGRAGDVAMYTGNDDHIVGDLLTEYRFYDTSVRFVGGLLGQWAVWTDAAVVMHAAIREAIRGGGAMPSAFMTIGAALTDANAAIFDAQNAFAGCVAGINEVAVRSGLLAGNWCLAKDDVLSPGQVEEITRVSAEYPFLTSARRMREFVQSELADIGDASTFVSKTMVAAL